jgi:hypothetical protein
MADMQSAVGSAVVGLGVRAGRDELLDVLRSRALECAVAPAEPGGWAAVYFAEDVDHARLAGELSAVLKTPVVVCSSDEKRASVRVWRGGRQLAGFGTDIDADPRVAATGDRFGYWLCRRGRRTAGVNRTCHRP